MQADRGQDGLGEAPPGYVERPAPRQLTDVVATVWVQRVGDGPRAQRDLPSGCIEVRCRLGSEPEVVGPLTRPRVQVLAPGSTVVGVRLRPDAAARLVACPVSELADEVLGAGVLWPESAPRLGEDLAVASTPASAVRRLVGHVREALLAAPADPLVGSVIEQLRWRRDDVGAIAHELHVSERQLRRRMLAGTGLPPKSMHRTLRFQRFLAFAQYAVAQGRAPDDHGLARLAAEAGFADQAHLTRECVRLSGLTPGAFLRGIGHSCACGHDHAAAYGPLLRARSRPLS